jgi:hypothetical protein
MRYVENEILRLGRLVSEAEKRKDADLIGPDLAAFFGPVFTWGSLSSGRCGWLVSSTDQRRAVYSASEGYRCSARYNRLPSGFVA